MKKHWITMLAFLLCLGIFLEVNEAKAAGENGLVKDGYMYYYYREGELQKGIIKVNDSLWYLTNPAMDDSIVATIRKTGPGNYEGFFSCQK